VKKTRKRSKKTSKNLIRKFRMWVIVSIVLAISFVGFTYRQSSITGQLTETIESLEEKKCPLCECPDIHCMQGFKAIEPSKVLVNHGRLEIAGNSVDSTDCRDVLIEGLSQVEDYRCEINNIVWDESENKIKADCVCSWIYK